MERGLIVEADMIEAAIPELDQDETTGVLATSLQTADHGGVMRQMKPVADISIHEVLPNRLTTA